MKAIVLLFVLLSACSHQTKESPQEVAWPRPVSEKGIRECQEYQKKLRFSSNVREARIAFSNFDFKKSFAEAKAQLVQAILSKCDAELITRFNQEFKALNRCSIPFTELEFFQALAPAITKNPWPTDLRFEAKNLALEYVRFHAQGSKTLLNRLVALSVLDELSINQVVNQALHSEIKQIMIEAQQYMMMLQQRVAKDPALSCEGLDILRDEFSYSDQVSVKMQSLLERI